MSIEKQIKLLETLLYFINNNEHISVQYNINDDDFIEYLESIKSSKTEDGEYVIYYDESIINKMKYDLRELKLKKIIDMI